MSKKRLIFFKYCSSQVFTGPTSSMTLRALSLPKISISVLMMKLTISLICVPVVQGPYSYFSIFLHLSSCLVNNLSINPNCRLLSSYERTMFIGLKLYMKSSCLFNCRIFWRKLM